MTYRMSRILPVLFTAVVLMVLVIFAGNTPANAETSDAAILLGDADSDGVVTINDVTEIQRDVSENPVCEGYSELAADVDGNGRIDISDATIIQGWLAEFDTSYPIGEPIDIPEPTTEAPTQMPTDDEGWGRIIFQP